MNKTITLKADTFKYPTKEERKKINQVISEVKNIEVDYKSATIAILENEPFENAIKSEDIYWWSNCLTNRLGKLRETYVYVQTHFLRTKEDVSKESLNSYTDKILLDYYIEIFYYFYFSSRDVLGQLINLVEDLKIEENKIFLNEKFVEKVKTSKTKEALNDFLNNTKDSYKIRNSFNHRFTPTHIDNRATKNITKEDNTIGFNIPAEIEIETFIDDIENLMNQISSLMNILSKEIK
ncbi:Cthe_2314 family HEPN domain-containing protein [Niabella hibiscisoli]|uniref:Cthe_2314 family HEPN domain-containing protein n=1 Tax=Niabella hibiscisoli TaxID=1825928 RepID=UPI001F0DD043|nr:Cthe_2314 family HEPN domain-containing protein [Niabella hibiscisoli]MCH5716437.1 Cthe_2314 family HEPN domain-containing protein [Niabella hibiscisoli]